MRVVKLAVIFIAISSLVCSCGVREKQSKTEGISITSSFKKGVTYNFEVVSNTTDIKNPENVPVIHTIQTTLTLIKDEGGVRECSWVRGRTMEPGMSVKGPSTRGVHELNFQGFDVRFAIDAEGRFQQLTNYESCRKQLDGIFLNAFKNKYLDDTATVDKLIEAVKKGYDTPEKVMSAYCRDIMLYFDMFGHVLRNDEISTSYSRLTNPFGSRSIPCKSSFKITKIEDGIAYINEEVVISKKELGKIRREKKININPYRLFKRPTDENSSNLDFIDLSVTSSLKYDIENKVLLEVSREELIKKQKAAYKKTVKITLKS